MTHLAIPVNGALPSAPALERAAVSSNHPIEPKWKERFVHLQPAWYEVKKITRAVGGAFAALAVLLLAATAATLFALQAKTIVVITVASGLILLTAFVALISLGCLFEKDFWKDPDFCADQAKKAWDDIKQNQLPFFIIQQKYGEGITNGRLLNKEDINQLIKEDCSDYSFLIQKHGPQVFGILNETNRALLKQSFIDYIAKPSQGLTYSFNRLINDFAVEFREFNINPSELEHILRIQWKNLSYMEFRQCYSQCLEFPLFRGEVFVLDPASIKELKQKLLKAMISSPHHINSILADFADDIRIFNLDKAAIKEYITRKRADLVVNGDLDYLDFKSQVESNRVVPKEFLVHLERAFRAYLQQGHLGLTDIKNNFGPELKRFGITDAELARLVLPKEIERLVNKQQNYEEYQERNGVESLSFLTEEQKKQVSDCLKEYSSTYQQGYLSFKTQFHLDGQALNITLNELYFPVISSEWQRLLNGSLSYLAFLKRNGWDLVTAIANKEGDNKLALKTTFLAQSYPNMLESAYQESCHLLGISKEDIQQALGTDLSYASFKARHSLSPIRDGLLLEDQIAQLAAGLQQLIIQAPYAQMKDLIGDSSILGLNLKELLETRWKNYSIQRILKEEKEIFCEALANRTFKPEDWTDKAIEDLYTGSIKELLEKYPDLFRLQILHGEYPVLADLFNAEIDSISELEQLFSVYSDDIFKYKFLTPNSPKLALLIINYYLRNPQSLYEKNKLHPRIERLQLVNAKVGQILKEAKQAYDVFLAKCTKAKKHIQDNMKKLVAEAEAERLKMIADVKQAQGLDQAINNCETKRRDWETCKRVVDKCREKLEKAQRRQRNLNYNIKTLEQEIIQGQERERALQQIDPVQEAVRLNQAIQETKDKMAKLTEISITKATDRLRIDSRKDELRRNIDKLRNQIAEIDQMPSKIAEMQAKIAKSQEELNSLQASLLELTHQIEEIEKEFNQLKHDFDSVDQTAIETRLILSRVQKEVRQVESQAQTAYSSKVSEIDQYKQALLEQASTRFKANVEKVNQKMASALQALSQQTL